MDIESDLKRALRRERPPAGFADRVLARLDEPHSAPRPRWRAVAAGILLTAVVGGWAARQEIHRREGEKAREEVLLALHIAGAKMRAAQEHVREIGSH